MKWFQLLSMTCLCGAKKQFAGNNRRHALGLAGAAGWKFGGSSNRSFEKMGDVCPSCVAAARKFETEDNLLVAVL